MAKRRNSVPTPSGIAPFAAEPAGDAGTAAGAGPAPDEARLEREVLDVCESIGTFIEWWGFKAIHGRIWTLLALHRTPLTQVEIAEFLGVSRSLVSISIAELTELDLVRPTQSHRNAPYVANMDVWPVVREVLRKREWMMMERTRVSLEGALQQARHAESARPGHESRFDPERIVALAGMTEMAQSLLRLLIAIRMPTSGGSLVGWLAKASSMFSWLRGENPATPPDADGSTRTRGTPPGDGAAPGD